MAQIEMDSILLSPTFPAEVTSLADHAAYRARAHGANLSDQVIVVCEHDDPTGRQILVHLSESQGLDFDREAHGLHRVCAAVLMRRSEVAAMFGRSAHGLADALAKPPPSSYYWLAVVADCRLQLALRHVPQRTPVAGPPGRACFAWPRGKATQR